MIDQVHCGITKWEISLSWAAHVWCVRLISETGTQLSAALPCVSQCLWTSMELVRWPITMQLSDSLPCVSQCLWTSMELVRMLWLFWINCCIVSEKLCLGAPVFRVATRDSVQFWIVNFWCTMANWNILSCLTLLALQNYSPAPWPRNV